MRALRSKKNQRGISFIGLLFVAVVLACVGVVVAQVIPTVIEYQAISKAANRAKEGTTVIATATPVHRGRRTQVWQTRLETEEGKLVAVVTQNQLVL